MDMAIINPVAFQLGPVAVHWYGMILGTAALVGLWFAIKEGKRIGISADDLMDLLLWAVPAAIIGARLYYVIFQWNEYYATHPGDIIAVWKGGLAIHGALIASVITGYIFAKKKRISFWRLADLTAPSIILGQAIGRWGNFINQEAHGGEVSRQFLENLYLPQFIIEQMNIGGVYYHPTFLYESLWNLLGFFLLISLRHLRWPRRGEIFLSYMVWYSIGRFFVEGLRTDSLMLTETIRIAQAISLALIGLAVVLFVVRRRTGLARLPYGE